SRRRHTRSYGDWSSDVCSSDLPVSARLARRTSDPPQENVPRILVRRPQREYVENWLQSHLTHSMHFRDSAPGHRPATRSQSAIRFPASHVVLPSGHRSLVSLCPPATAPLQSAAGRRPRPGSLLAPPLLNEDQKPPSDWQVPESRSSRFSS